jgi:hypothetical protein
MKVPLLSSLAAVLLICTRSAASSSNYCSNAHHHNTQHQVDQTPFVNEKTLLCTCTAAVSYHSLLLYLTIQAAEPKLVYNILHC